VADAFVLTFTEVGRGRQLTYPLIVKSTLSFLFCRHGRGFGLCVIAQSDCVDFAQVDIFPNTVSSFTEANPAHTHVINAVVAKFIERQKTGSTVSQNIFA
jgi:hypothetical protein